MKGRVIGHRIQEIRLSSGLTLEEFGKKFDPIANKSNVSKWEKGKAMPSPERLKIIAELGGVSIDYLLGSDLKICPQCQYDALKADYKFCPICGLEV